MAELTNKELADQMRALSAWLLGDVRGEHVQINQGQASKALLTAAALLDPAPLGAMSTSLPKPMQGLAAWLRAQAAHPCASEADREAWTAWAREVDTATGVTTPPAPGELEALSREVDAMPGAIRPSTPWPRNAGVRASAQPDYPECSGDPANCPENEGHGCCGSYECKAAQRDGVLCADGECRDASGVPVAAPPSCAHDCAEAVAGGPRCKPGECVNPSGVAVTSQPEQKGGA